MKGAQTGALVSKKRSFSLSLKINPGIDQRLSDPHWCRGQNSAPAHPGSPGSDQCSRDTLGLVWRFEFATAQPIIFGMEVLAEAGPLAKELGRRPLVVTGRDSSLSVPSQASDSVRSM